MRSGTIAREIAALDPVRDHCRIQYLLTGCEFPWDTRRALELALMRTFCVPSIARLLDYTGELRENAQRRYDDTALLVAELCDHGYDSDCGKRALRRINRMHGRYVIPDDDYVYVLSTFVLEPIRWIERYGWRALTEAEQQATFYFWREVGWRMNVVGIPPSLAELEEYNLEYEWLNFRSTPAARRLGGATRELFASWFPSVARPVARAGVGALLDERVREVFGFAAPPAWLAGGIERALRLRQRVLRALPERTGRAFVRHAATRSHPKGYRIEELGPGSEARPPLGNPAPNEGERPAVR